MSEQKDSRINSNKMTYNIQKGKYVICKDSVYFALTMDQVLELSALIDEIVYRESIVSSREGK